MNKEKLTTPIIIVTSLIIIFIIYMCIVFKPNERQVFKRYQVYLSGKKIGLISSKDELYDLIDEEQKDIKDQYKVNKVYPPTGLEVQMVTTYNDELMSSEEIYNEIKDLAPFTIEGYEVAIKDGKKVKKLYILNKNDLDVAVRNTVTAFVKEKDYDNYLKNKVANKNKSGVEITDIYFDKNVSLKKAYISTEDKIFTDSDELSQYFLFGTNDLNDKYVVKSTDTIQTIADKNHFGVSDFLIANPDLAGENALLAPGQVVSVAAISPIVNIIVEKYQTETQTIKHETKIKYDKTKSATYSETKQKGSNGTSKVVYATKEMNGVILKTKLVSQETIVPAVDKIVVVGAKNVVYYGNSTYWAWPTSKPFKISDNYGWRICPFHGKEFHAALDITGTPNRNIYAIQSGTVTEAVASGYNGGQGKYITVKHNDTYTSHYWHLNKLLVKKGDKVEKGQLIGIMGCTGSCTGTHLDFRVQKNGEYVNPFSIYQ